MPENERLVHLARVAAAEQAQNTANSVPMQAAVSVPMPGLAKGVRASGRPVIQAKLEVGSSSDPSEVAADLVADRVVEVLRQHQPSADAPVARMVTAAPLRTLTAMRQVQPRRDSQGVIGAEGGEVGSKVEAMLRQQATGGRALPSGIRSQMEPALGTDLSAIRVHDGPEASALNRQISARAFTMDSHIFFRDGLPDTSSAAGQHLLAHELAHTVQQQPGVVGRAAVRRETDVLYMDSAGVGHEEPDTDPELPDVLYMDPAGVGHEEPDKAPRLPKVLYMDQGGVAHKTPDHSALEAVLSAKQANGPGFKPMGAVRGARKQAEHAIRKDRMAEVNALRAGKPVKGSKHGAVEAAAGAKLEQGFEHKPMSKVRGARGDRKKAAAKAVHGEKSAARTAEYQALDAKTKSMTDVLASARAAQGTEHEVFEVGQLDAALAAKKWAEALPVLDQIKAISAAALAAARSQLAGRSEDIAKVKLHPQYHQPTGLAKQESALSAGLTEAQWTTIGGAVKTFLETVDQALDFAARLTEVRVQAADLTNSGRQRTLNDWIALHEKMSWEEVVQSSDNVGAAKGGLANLEDRLLQYQTLDENAAVSAAKSKTKAQAATTAALAAKEAAKVLRQERLAKGLLAGNGTVLAQKKPSELTGNGETAAVDAALKALKDGTPLALSHSGGARRNFPHDNRDGDLPGAKNSGGYLETYVEKDPDSLTYHGNRRLVVHTATKRIYYTWTHYGAHGNPAFVLLTP